MELVYIQQKTYASFKRKKVNPTEEKKEPEDVHTLPLSLQTLDSINVIPPLLVERWLASLTDMNQIEFPFDLATNANVRRVRK